MIVANGILGVRNRAGVAKDVFRWREDTASGTVLGPQIAACGPLIDGPNPAHPEQAISVHNAAESRQAVRSLKAMGVDLVTVYDGVPKNSYFAIAAEAKQLHLPFVGQVPGEIRIREASDAGQHSLEHGEPLSGGSTFEDEKIKEEMTGPISWRKPDKRMISPLSRKTSQSSLAEASIAANLDDGTASVAPAGSIYRTAPLHFQLRNCGANIPVTTATTLFVQDTFDLRPATPGATITGTIIGNDQILCGNVASTFYLVTIQTLSKGDLCVRLNAEN